MVDYEEQVFITGIKAYMQYPICYFPLKKKNESQNREIYQPKLTWKQLKRQVNNPAIQRDKAVDDWLYPQESFAWNHKYINILAILLSDILHQLYKIVVTNLVS